MRRFSVAIPVLITGVCLYFVFAFGREAIAIFSSPIWGLENQRFRARGLRHRAGDGLGPTALCGSRLFSAR